MKEIKQLKPCTTGENCGDMNKLFNIQESTAKDAINPLWSRQLLLLILSMREIGFDFSEAGNMLNKHYMTPPLNSTDCSSATIARIPDSYISQNKNDKIYFQTLNYKKNETGCAYAARHAQDNFSQIGYMSVPDLLQWVHSLFFTMDIVAQNKMIQGVVSNVFFKTMSINSHQTLFYVENNMPGYYVLVAYIQPANIGIVIATNTSVTQAMKRVLLFPLFSLLVGS